MNETYTQKYNFIFDSCIQVLKDLRFDIEYKNADKGVIEASTKSSIFSWGENIIIKLEKNSNAGILVSVNSNAKAQIIDWGVNLKNEKIIMKKLTELLK